MKKISEHKDKIIGLLITIIFLIQICKNLDVRKLIETFKIFNYKTLYVFIPLYILSIFIRGLRWKYLLCSAKNFTAKDAFFVFTSGNTINSYLPARAGDFWRAYHVGNKLNISKAKVLGSIILERIIDGIAILLVLFTAVILHSKQQWILNITAIASVLFIGSLSIAFVTYKINKTNELFHYLGNLKILKKAKPILEKTAKTINNLIDGFESLSNSKCFFMAFLTSCIAWGLECFVTYILIIGFGMHFSFTIAMFVISFLALSTIIPSSSIFVGPYQYAYILALSIYGIEKSNGLGIAFIHQIVIMLIITIISIIYFSLNNTSINDIKDNINNVQINPTGD